jgi:hypothetical protein
MRNAMRRRAPVAGSAAVLALAVTAALMPMAAYASKPSGVEKLQIYFSGHGTVQNPTRVVATGLFRDHGTETQNGSTGVLTLKLTHGTITGHFHDEGYKLNFNAAACVALPTSHGTTSITGGTGKYSTLTGSFSYTMKGRLVGKRSSSGDCLAASAPPKLSNVTESATGHVQLGG